MREQDYYYIYEVRQERNFFEIAEEFQVNEMILRAANPALRQVRRGAEIKIPMAACPSGAFHSLKEGEGIFDLAVGSGSAAGEVLSANPGFVPGRAIAGQTVVVPEQERTTRVYEVCSTDHLWDILRKFEMSAPALRGLNPGVDIFSLREGQEVVVLEYISGRQMEGVYTLQTGETLLSVCEQFSLSPAEVLRANQNLRPQDFTRGMRIVLPTKG